eukprot:691922-Hanusia_phi.AAC.3
MIAGRRRNSTSTDPRQALGRTTSARFPPPPPPRPPANQTTSQTAFIALSWACRWDFPLHPAANEFELKDQKYKKLTTASATLDTIHTTSPASCGLQSAPLPRQRLAGGYQVDRVVDVGHEVVVVVHNLRHRHPEALCHVVDALSCSAVSGWWPCRVDCKRSADYLAPSCTHAQT